MLTEQQITVFIFVFVVKLLKITKNHKLPVQKRSITHIAVLLLTFSPLSVYVV